MTATTDITTDGTYEEGVPQAEAAGGYDSPPQPPAGRAMIAVKLLTAHPGNVRRDVSLDLEFLASITELGILTPLRITPDGPGGYRVIEGHRRLAAAEHLGLTEVPYDLAAECLHDIAPLHLGRERLRVQDHRPRELDRGLIGDAPRNRDRHRRPPGRNREDRRPVGVGVAVRPPVPAHVVGQVRERVTAAHADVSRPASRTG